jgi:anti-sigma factor RsiW
MRCDDVRTQLSALLDGELAPSQAEAVRRHVQACARCALECEDLDRVKRRLDESRIPENAGMAERIMVRLACEGPPRVQPAGGPRSRRWLGVLLGASAAAAALLLCVLVGGPGGVRPPEPPDRPVEQLFETAGSIVADVTQALAETGRGVSVVPGSVAEGARSAWSEIAANDPSHRLSRAVDRGETLFKGSFGGVSAAVLRLGDLDRYLSSFAEEDA